MTSLSGSRDKYVCVIEMVFPTVQIELFARESDKKQGKDRKVHTNIIWSIIQALWRIFVIFVV